MHSAPLSLCHLACNRGSVSPSSHVGHSGCMTWLYGTIAPLAFQECLPSTCHLPVLSTSTYPLPKYRVNGCCCSESLCHALLCTKPMTTCKQLRKQCCSLLHTWHCVQLKQVCGTQLCCGNATPTCVTLSSLLRHWAPTPLHGALLLTSLVLAGLAITGCLIACGGMALPCMLAASDMKVHSRTYLL